MKKLILMLVFILTMTGCVAQKVDSLKRGHTIGKVIEATESIVVVTGTYGRNLVVDGELEVGVEYNLVYDILQERPDGTLVVKLVAAEESDRQNALNRARLLTLLKK
jgi:hypothetical protein